MREIEFRAWDKVLKKMWHQVEGYNGQGPTSISFYDVISTPSRFIPMQYTGLKDKNGVKIFEGDRINGGLYNGSYRIGVVEYYKGEFGLSPEGKFAEGWCSLTYPGLEVIGNIHQTEKQDDHDQH